MEEATGATRTDSKGSNDLSDTGSVQQAAGKSGNAAWFTDAADVLSISDNADVSPTSGLAISLWFKFAGGSYAANIFRKNLSYSIHFNASNLIFGIWDSSNFKSISTTRPAVNTWTHLLGLAVDGVVYFYVNGSLISSTSFSAIDDNANSLQLGSNLGQGVNHGHVDEANLWKNITFATTAKRDAFVNALYNSGSGKFYTAP